MKMTETYYEKIVTAKWFDERLKKTVDIVIVTYEMSEKPDRVEILEKTLLKDHPSAGDIAWYDAELTEFYEGMAIYPLVEIRHAYVQDISEKP
jgi:hypothetical protein